MSMVDVTIAEFATLLRATAPLLKTLLESLPAPLTQFRPAPGEWSSNEVIGHLIEAEQRGFGGRIQHILSEERHICLTWDPDQVAAARQDNVKSSEALWREFAQVRAQSVLLVAGLQPTQLGRSGLHPTVGELSVRDLLYEWVYHDYNHLRQIQNNVNRALWPQMGNAQRFYS